MNDLRYSSKRNDNALFNALIVDFRLKLPVPKVSIYKCRYILLYIIPTFIILRYFAIGIRASLVATSFSRLRCSHQCRVLFLAILQQWQVCSYYPSPNGKYQNFSSNILVTNTGLTVSDIGARLEMTGLYGCVLNPRRKVAALRDGDVLFVCFSFVRLSPTRTEGGWGLSRRLFGIMRRCVVTILHRTVNTKIFRGKNAVVATLPAQHSIQVNGPL